MSVRILTGGLLGLLSDLIQTADRTPEAGVMGGLLLHTGRGHHGAEPGQVELLAGVSSDRRIAGHTYTWCSGQLGAPSWWSLRDARSVLTVFKAARGKDKQGDHAVEIIRTGGEVIIREDPNLIDEGVSLSFGEGDPGDYPAPILYRALDRELPSTVLRDGAFVDAQPRTDLMAQLITPFCKVAVRRGEVLQLYRSHQQVPVLIQIGDTYRGLVQPYHGTDIAEPEAQRPGADLYAPDLDDPLWRRRPATAGGDQPPPMQLDLDTDLDTDPGSDP